MVLKAAAQPHRLEEAPIGNARRDRFVAAARTRLVVDIDFGAGTAHRLRISHLLFNNIGAQLMNGKTLLPQPFFGLLAHIFHAFEMLVQFVRNLLLL